MLFVVGDSNVRAFSVFSGVIPIMAGSGAQLNFTTNKNYKITLKKIYSLLRQLPKGSNVLFSLNTDHRFISRLNNKNKKAEIVASVNRYLEMVEEAVSQFEIKPIMMSPTPNYSSIKDKDAQEIWNIYTEDLVNLAQKRKICVIDLRELCTSDTLLSETYDNIHFSDRLAFRILTRIFDVQDLDDFFRQAPTWHHTHFLGSDGAKIVGNFNVNDLIISNYRSLNLDLFNNRNSEEKKLYRLLAQKLTNIDFSTIIALCDSEGASNEIIRKLFNTTYYFDEMFLERAIAIRYFSDESYALELINFDALRSLDRRSIVVLEDCEMLSSNTIQKLAKNLDAKIPIVIINSSWAWADSARKVFSRNRGLQSIEMVQLDDGLYCIGLDNKKNTSGIIKKLLGCLTLKKIKV